MRRINLSLLCVMAVLAMAMNLADPFEATKWKVKLAPDEEARRSGEKELDDTLGFKSGLFSSAAMAKHGFKPAQYEEDTRRYGPAQFKVEQKSESEGTAKWTGTIAANTVKGDMVWTKKDGKVLNFTFSGEREDH